MDHPTEGLVSHVWLLITGLGATCALILSFCSIDAYLQMDYWNPKILQLKLAHPCLKEHRMGLPMYQRIHLTTLHHASVCKYPFEM